MIQISEHISESKAILDNYLNTEIVLLLLSNQKYIKVTSEQFNPDLLFVVLPADPKGNFLHLDHRKFWESWVHWNVPPHVRKPLQENISLSPD